MRLQGVLAPIPTPIDHADTVRPALLGPAFDRWLATPLAGFVVLGTNGEAALLDDRESDAVLGAARECIPAGRLFVAGAGRESTAATVSACRRAAALGADMVIVRTPGFFKAQMTTEVFIRHYQTVAEASPVPVLLYNFTAVTGVNLPPAAVAALAGHPNIVGLKESGGDLAQITAFVADTPDDFAVFAGSASTFYLSLCAGVSGGILAVANVAADACVRLFEAAAAGRHDEAKAWQRRLLPLARAIGAHGVAGLKAAVRLTGCDLGVPRPPLAPLPNAAIEQLRSALVHLQEVAA